MQDVHYINFRKARAFDEILRTVFLFVRFHLKPLFRSLAVICGPFFLVVGIVGGLFYGEILPGAFQSYPGNTYPDESSLPTFILYYVLFIVFMMGGILMLITVVNAFISLYVDNGEAPTIEEVWQKTKSNILPMIGATILTSILTLRFFSFFPESM
jgi:hypothetical protein